MKKLFLILLTLTSISAFCQSNGVAKDTLTAVVTPGSGTSFSYQWTQLSGPQCDVTGVSSPTIIITFTNPGQYSFRCTTTDNLGQVVYSDVSGVIRSKNVPQTLRISPSSFDLQLK